MNAIEKLNAIKAMSKTLSQFIAEMETREKLGIKETIVINFVYDGLKPILETK